MAGSAASGSQQVKPLLAQAGLHPKAIRVAEVKASPIKEEDHLRHRHALKTTRPERVVAVFALSELHVAVLDDLYTELQVLLADAGPTAACT